ncbi:MAG: type 3 dihydrofolate reductase [bacterium]
MKVSIVVAMGKNRVIGNAQNEMPWRLPADLRHFREVTMGKPIVMGRKTHESIGRPLPGRHNIIVTRGEGYQSEGCTVVNSVEAALAAAGDVDEVMITGGANIYEQFLSKTDYLYLTFIEGIFEGNIHFPAWDDGSWIEVSRESHQPDAENPHPWAFVEYTRRTS